MLYNPKKSFCRLCQLVLIIAEKNRWEKHKFPILATAFWRADYRILRFIDLPFQWYHIYI